PTSVGKDTQHELDQPLKKSAYVSNHRGPLLFFQPSQCPKTVKPSKKSNATSNGKKENGVQSRSPFFLLYLNFTAKSRKKVLDRTC
ncbi:hypothetical protein, partial [Vibrio cincinnatiensis]